MSTWIFCDVAWISNMIPSRASGSISFGAVSASSGRLGCWLGLFDGWRLTEGKMEREGFSLGIELGAALMEGDSETDGAAETEGLVEMLGCPDTLG